MLEVKTTKTLSEDDVANIIVTAFEGGINYWCEKAIEVYLANRDWHEMTFEQRHRFRKDGCGPYSNGLFWGNSDRGYQLYTDEGEKAELVLNRASLQHALDKLASKEHWHDTLRRLASEDYDADDADVLVQFAVFGELVFG